MKLISMKRTRAEKKENIEPCAPSSTLSSVEEYPYGLEIRLEKESLKKLGIDVDDVAIGRKVHIEAVAKITNLNKSVSMSNDSSSMSIQITDMSITMRGNDNPKTIKSALRMLGALK